MTQVTVIDYGAGNLLSVVRALKHVGADVKVTHDPEDVSAATRLVLPGVGAFADCMQALDSLALTQPIRDYIARDRLFLGICVGMQVLFEVGEEFGEYAGLGCLPGRAQRIPDKDAAGNAHKIPHIGWSPLLEPSAGIWNHSLLSPIMASENLHHVYFVHSYAAVPARDEDRLADVDYHGLRVCAAVRRGSVYGVQFHPEKSGKTGLALLSRFLEL